MILVGMAGVASAQINFWQNVGGTVGIAVLGSLMANWLPGDIAKEVVALHVLPEKMALLGDASTNPQILFDPNRLAAIRSGLAAGDASTFDKLMLAVRNGLVVTLSDLFVLRPSSSWWARS